MSENFPRSVETVRAALTAAGATGADSVRHIPDGARTAAEGHRVDTVALAERIGVAEIGRANPEIVKAATGQVIGGVAPVGHPSPLPTYVDEALEQFPEIWAAAGHSHAVFPLTYAELVRITGGTVVAVD